MEHSIRVLGPYSPDDDARAHAERMAEIQTAAWADWLASEGVDEETIKASLWSDVENEDHMDARERTLRSALRRDGEGAVLYFGAHAAGGEMVGFAKFKLYGEDIADEHKLIVHLHEIDVLPAYQGKRAENPQDHNLAKKMMYGALAQLQHEDVVLRLEVLASNARAKALYERLGLHVVGELGEFIFEDNDENPVRREPHVRMEGQAIAVKRKLRADLGF